MHSLASFRACGHDIATAFASVVIVTFHFRRDRLVAVILIISFSVILDSQVLLELVSDILLTVLLSRIEKAVFLLALF